MCVKHVIIGVAFFLVNIEYDSFYPKLSNQFFPGKVLVTKKILIGQFIFILVSQIQIGC